MNLRRRERTERSGLVRTARVDRQVDRLVARARPGDIAVIDVIDLDRRTAEQLVAAGVSAVVNAAPSCSGRFPVRGPQTLLEAGVVLVDDVGGEVFSRVRDGDTVRLDGATVYAAGERVVEGSLQTDESVAASTAHARGGLQARLGALVADAAERLGDDDGRLLEGDGFPPLTTDFTDRVVVVVTGSSQDAELRAARDLARRRGTTVVAVGDGVDRARAARVDVDLVVIGRSGATPAAVARAREVLVLDGADLDVPVPSGVPRAHAISLGSPEDTAVLLAHTRGASMVVTCGVDESLGGVLDRSVSAGSVPMLGGLRGGGRHATASAVAALRTRRRSTGLVAFAAVAGLLLGALVVSGPVRTALDDRRTSSSSPALSAAQQAAADGSVFQSAVTPALVGGRLAGHVVLVVQLPGAVLPAGLIPSLSGSGAGITGPLVLRPTYVDSTRSRVLRDLAVQVAPRAVQQTIGAQPAGTSADAQLDTVLTSALVTRTGVGLGSSDPATGTVVTGLARVGALDPLAAPLRLADLVVVVAPAASGSVEAERGAAFAAALARQSSGVVLVTSTAPGTVSGGSTAVVRSATGTRHVSTVDDVATPTGEVATVLALDARARGAAPGDYGQATDADAIVPSTRSSGTSAQH